MAEQMKEIRKRSGAISDHRDVEGLKINRAYALRHATRGRILNDQRVVVIYNRCMLHEHIRMLLDFAFEAQVHNRAQATHE